MRTSLGTSLRNLMWVKTRKSRISALAMLLSVIVSLNVFFALRQPGLTLAGDACCGILEHSHDEACGVLECICGFPEEGHVHGDSCYEVQLVEAQENRYLVCEVTEQPHVHGEGCYQTIVTEASEQTSLICENVEEGHVHEDGCYETVQIPGCEETVLVCNRVADPHEHSESCYAVEIIEAQENKVLICDIPECLHVHEDACYEWRMTCEQLEHIHSMECYSDQTADVETPLDWQKMFAGYPYSGNLRRDLAGIARMQVGYAESERNFEVGSDGTRRGYTRYGAWYGVPYGDWSAMFVSFCLDYAGADYDEAPGNTGASSMAKTWDKLGKYAPKGEYTPVEGDLVFFKDHTVGIVTDVVGSTFYAVCGDVENAVVSVSMSMADSSIKGWGSTVGTVAAEETPVPTAEPTAAPTVEPTAEPTATLTAEPTAAPTAAPTVEPTAESTATPTAEPTAESTSTPTVEPTAEPTATPTVEPTAAPTATPTAEPTAAPTAAPTVEPTATPTVEPTAEPTATPTVESTVEPTATPTVESTVEPTATPTVEPSAEPTAEPTMAPAEEGSGLPEQDSLSQEISDEKLLDISNGPAVFLFVDGEAQTQMQRFSLKAAREIVDLIQYLQKNGGSYFFTLLDKNNQELPKDTDGNYIVQAETGYKLTISFTSPKGFHPGTYQYQVPNGLLVDGGAGDFILKDGTNVGSWNVTNEGLITMHFNEHMNSRSDITISATLGINFPLQEEPIDFDGKISVIIEKPPQELEKTELVKWGNQGILGNSDTPDPSKMYWNVHITGKEGSQIPGSTMTDRVINGDYIGVQHYTQSDMDAGLKIGAGVTNPVTGKYDWHAWYVTPGDPNLAWTEDGWSYTFPETATCVDCGEITLGNLGWEYFIHYSSTPLATGSAGTLYYMNRVELDGQFAEGGANFTNGDAEGEITKEGSFVANAGDGAFHWEFRATIPSRKESQKADYYWYISDNMYLLNNESSIESKMENDANYATVTANYNGSTIYVPRIQDATGDSLFAWDNAWTAQENGINYGRQIQLLCRCTCTPETCPLWERDGHCWGYGYIPDEGGWATTTKYCQCWNLTGDTTFTFSYKTDDLSMIGMYGGRGYSMLNVADLYYKPDRDSVGMKVDSGQDSVPIPEIFDKELTHDFDGYTAHYQITVNEAMVPLTNGSSLTIRDEMSPSLTFVSGSMVIITEDANGNTATLQQDRDYTVTYDGTGGLTHILNIVIKHPQPVKYILDYDTTIVIPSSPTEAVKYSNTAHITLWGEDMTDSSDEKVYAELNIAAKSYRVEMFKTASNTGEPLSGAKFGLYNAQGGLITTKKTDQNGCLDFQTDVIQGIVLREHLLYYMQELQAPPGYQLDDSKYWFCFCDSTGSHCATCDQVMAGTDAFRIPFEQIEKINVQNELLSYNLPGTGGPSVYPLIYASAVCIAIPLVCGFLRRCKWEGRGEK